jgi:hypothetical protein
MITQHEQLQKLLQLGASLLDNLRPNQTGNRSSNAERG